MKVIHGLENVPREPGAAVTVGSFDGLHVGHQRILRLMRRAGNRPLTVLTFDPHPQSIVRPDLPPPPLLTSLDERVALFRRYGAGRLIFARFDERFAELRPEDYVTQILVGMLGAGALFVGPNHRFGKGRQGDVELLKRLGQSNRFAVEIVPPVVSRGEVVSSSRIRKRLLGGDAATALRFLGRPYYISGVVVAAEGRGRRLGFPTANLAGIEAGKLLPPPGIYATVTEFDGERWPSVSHIGPRPTFPGVGETIETHLIGFDGDLYDKVIRIGLVDRLRDVLAFDAAQELVRQMEEDRRVAAERLASGGFAGGARREGRRFSGKVAKW